MSSQWPRELRAPLANQSTTGNRRQDETVALQFALLEEAQRNHGNRMSEGSSGFDGFSGFSPTPGFSPMIGFGYPRRFGSRGFRGPQPPPILRCGAAQASAQAQPTDDKSEAFPTRFSRACSICCTENPRERAVFTQCGHIICYDCAVKHARQSSIGTTCVFCRAPSGFVKLFEEEASDEPEPDNALLGEVQSLKKRLAEYNLEYEKLQKIHRDFSVDYENMKKKLAKCSCGGKPSFPIKKYEALQRKHIEEHQAMVNKHLDECREYDRRIQYQASEIEFMQLGLSNCSCGGLPSVPLTEHEALQKKHRNECEEYKGSLQLVRSLKEHLIGCSCLGQPSVRIEEHQAMVDKYETSLKLQQSQMAAQARSLQNKLDECSCGGKPSVPVETHQEASQKKHRDDYKEYVASLKLESSLMADEI